MVVYSSKFRLGGDVSTSSRRYIAGSSEDIHKEREEQKGLYTLLSQKNSRQTVNGDYSAIRMLYTKVLIRGGEPPRPRREKILPTVL